MIWLKENSLRIREEDKSVFDDKDSGISDNGFLKEKVNADIKFTKEGFRNGHACKYGSG